MATNNSLILLQENSGRVPLPDSVPGALKDALYAMIDATVESLETLKTMLQGAGRYDVVHSLTDNECTRARLLDTMIEETRKGRVFDLVILGHGGPERLVLKRAPHLTNTSIRALKTDAAARGRRGVTSFNLRMVFMCNCHGSSVNDDWLAAGAKVSVGSRANNYMPEPMTTFFLHNWMNGQKASDAARHAYEATIPFYRPFYPPTIRVKTKRTTVKVPCPTWSEPFRMCDKVIEVPDGIETIDNAKITDSQPLTAGASTAVF